MAKDPYVFAPELDEDEHGTVKIADEYGVWHTFDVAGARAFRDNLDAVIGAADEDPARPRTECDCGYELVWIVGDWEHDAAPSLWGDDHDPSATPATGPAREFWDGQDGLL